MKVSSRQVTQIVIGDGDVVLSREEAFELYKQLAATLGQAAFEAKGCGDRLSHSAHVWGQDGAFYCRGLAFDRT